MYLRGQQILNDPLLNKGAAFTPEERLALDLDGLLGSGTSDLDIQMRRNLDAFAGKPDDLEKFIYLQSLMDRNEVLFYRLLVDNLTEMIPIVYTPTVGQACQQLSRITRQYRGVFLSPQTIGRVDPILQSISLPNVAWASLSARSSCTSRPANSIRPAACRYAWTSALTTSRC